MICWMFSDEGGAQKTGGSTCKDVVIPTTLGKSLGQTSGKRCLSKVFCFEDTAIIPA